MSPDAVTYTLDDYAPLRAATLDNFITSCNPPEPTVVSRQHLQFNHDSGNFVVVGMHFHWANATDVGTIAAMSDGTFRFEAAS